MQGLQPGLLQLSGQQQQQQQQQTAPSALGGNPISFGSRDGYLGNLYHQIDEDHQFTIEHGRGVQLSKYVAESYSGMPSSSLPTVDRADFLHKPRHHIQNSRLLLKPRHQNRGWVTMSAPDEPEIGESGRLSAPQVPEGVRQFQEIDMIQQQLKQVNLSPDQRQALEDRLRQVVREMNGLSTFERDRYIAHVLTEDQVSKKIGRSSLIIRYTQFLHQIEKDGVRSLYPYLQQFISEERWETIAALRLSDLSDATQRVVNGVYAQQFMNNFEIPSHYQALMAALISVGDSKLLELHLNERTQARVNAEEIVRELADEVPEPMLQDGGPVVSKSVVPEPVQADVPPTEEEDKEELAQRAALTERFYLTFENFNQFAGFVSKMPNDLMKEIVLLIRDVVPNESSHKLSPDAPFKELGPVFFNEFGNFQKKTQLRTIGLIDKALQQSS